MGHYAAEMFVTGSRDGDEKLFEQQRRKEQQQGKAVFDQLLQETELTIDLKKLKNGDWLRMKEKFFEHPRGENGEALCSVRPYCYTNGGETLNEKFIEGNMWKKNKLGILETPFVVKGVDRKKGLVYFVPRGLLGTTREARRQMFHGEKGEYNYVLDARMLEYFTGHALQVTKVKDALLHDFDLLTGEEKNIIRKVGVVSLLEEHAELTLKDLICLFSEKSTAKQVK